ncbi:MAG: acetyl-CoA carboxylase biotin carboxyl carrier protein [Candidatus Glassbacteria bacterium]
MRLSYIKKLINLLEESDIGMLEISRWGTRVRIEKANPNSNPNSNSGEIAVKEGTTIKVPVAAEGDETTAEAGEVRSENRSEKNYHKMTAPMVGTFYRAPSPDAPPYIEVGDIVSKGQVLCIIEAMKLMNEIQSEVEGTVRKILVENAEPVEYGQELFLIEP